MWLCLGMNSRKYLEVSLEIIYIIQFRPKKFMRSHFRTILLHSNFPHSFINSANLFCFLLLGKPPKFYLLNFQIDILLRLKLPIFPSVRCPANEGLIIALWYFCQIPAVKINFAAFILCLKTCPVFVVAREFQCAGINCSFLSCK